MFPEERRAEIVKLLVKNKSISVKTLCDTLQSSEATIRRDLTQLMHEGLLERTHGGAIINDGIKLTQEDSFFQKEMKFHDEKIRIAKKAFEFIEENDSIVLDAGTTTLELAKLIGESDIRCTVITNSSTVSQVISKNQNIELYSLGGRVRLNTLATVGNYAIENLKKFNVKKAFIGANGITIENGLTTPDMAEAEMKLAMLKTASEITILVDHTKFNQIAFCQIAPINMVDRIITDEGLSQDAVNKFTQYDIDIIRA